MQQLPPLPLGQPPSVRVCVCVCVCVRVHVKACMNAELRLRGWAMCMCMCTHVWMCDKSGHVELCTHRHCVRSHENVY